jgi:hypothetical protein
MLLVFVTFLVSTALYVALLLFAFRRVTTHLQGNADATKAVVEHVLIPLLGRKLEEETTQEKGSES